MLQRCARCALLPVSLVMTAVEAAGGQTAPPPIEWHEVAWSRGTINVALVRPAEEGPAPHPVIFALPWGSGTRGLVEGFIDSYWRLAPGTRGYYVVAPEIRGTALSSTADEIIPAIFGWMDAELSYDAARVALVGASNGGTGIFHAALSQPDRFQALVGLPGQYSGDPERLRVLAGKPIFLIVGELDDRWVELTDRTLAALSSQGVFARRAVVREQGHVLRINPYELLAWIDGAMEMPR